MEIRLYSIFQIENFHYRFCRSEKLFVYSFMLASISICMCEVRYVTALDGRCMRMFIYMKNYEKDRL